MSDAFTPGKDNQNADENALKSEAEQALKKSHLKEQIADRIKRTIDPAYTQSIEKVIDVEEKGPSLPKRKYHRPKK